MLEEEHDDTSSPLSDRVIVDLSAHRTAALRDSLSQQPLIALLALTHSLAAQRFYHAPDASCLAIALKPVPIVERAPNIGGSRAMDDYTKRADGWAKRLPRDVDGLWEYLAALSRDELVSLLAVCVAEAVNALQLPWERSASRIEAAEKLADALSLDMHSYWEPTVESYFGAVTKAHILEAVREGVSEEAAKRLSGMKKEHMAKAAEKLLKGSGWLPALLRTPQKQAETAEAYAMAAE
jgi:ParB family transcriptional regulator, chromosome partitioning protein